MKIPIFLSANPQVATRSGIVRLPEGEWVISGEFSDTRVSIAIANEPLTLMENIDKQIPLTDPIHISGPKYVVAFVTYRGTESHFNVHAIKEKAA